MCKKVRTDTMKVGEEMEPLVFAVTPELNECYLDALEDHHPRYMQETGSGESPMVHPSLLIGHCGSRQSPSNYLPSGIGGVMTKEEIEFLNPGRVGKTFKVSWKVVDKYKKRDRPYMVREISVVDEDGTQILRLMTTSTFMGGPYPGRKEE